MFNRKKDRSVRELVANQETHYKQEVLAVGLLALFVFLCFALFTYHPHDSTLFYFSSDGKSIVNWSGALGANIAAFFFYLFGCAAFLLLPLLLFAFYLLFFKVPFKQERGRLIMLHLLMFVTAMLCATYQFDLISQAPGGLIGSSCNHLLKLTTGRQGSQVLLWTLLWIALCVIVRLPLISLIRQAASKSKQGLGKIWSLIRRKKQSDVPEAVAIAGATKSETQTNDYWNDVLQTSSQTASGSISHVYDLLETAANGVARTSNLAEKVNRFAASPLRQASGQRKVFTATLVQLPNTVLSKHLFADQLGTNPFEMIMNSVQSIKIAQTFTLPDALLFNTPPQQREQDQLLEEGKKRAARVEEKLQHFGVKGRIVNIKPGPVVTLFEYKPEIDSKISKIVSLEDDLAMALTAHSMRIIAPIPGKNAVGFEIANQSREDVTFSQIFTSPAFLETKAKLPIVLGVDAIGNAIVEDLATTPHLLVGGATGSGKSVGLNVMLISLLCKLNPDDLKLILVDPKRLEFTPYADIPHLLFPIVTQPARAAAVLSWVVQEMEERYEAMAAAGVRSVHEYRKLESGKNDEPLKPMPYLVVIIDELADLMMVAGKEVETKIVRIAQMARASGIHLIVATQRPSVDVVTGLIKVNFPSRVAFRVSSKVDSRTILDQQGAEKLLGRGDMLYMHASSPELKRVHGAYVSDREIERVTDFLRLQRPTTYLDLNEALRRVNDAQKETFEDELYPALTELIKTMGEISISMIQRHYRIGFNRSARLIEKLELDGLIAPAQGSKPRKVIR